MNPTDYQDIAERTRYLVRRELEERHKSLFPDFDEDRSRNASCDSSFFFPCDNPPDCP